MNPSLSTKPVMVSINMISYNHEKYISKAIEGVLLQKTSFPIELIISDDCSTDNTLAIIKEYAAKYSDIIKPVYREKNIGSMANFLDTFTYSTGKYIAICDGDDYWTDASKLQKQVDFLEENKDYSTCVHHFKTLEGNKLKDIPNPTGETFTIADVARGNFFASLSVVFRRDVLDQFPQWFPQSPLGDYVLHMLNARNGKIKYMPEIMGVYRMHSGGTWSGQSTVNQLKKMEGVLAYLLTEKFEENIIQLLKTQKRAITTAYLKLLLEFDPDSFNATFEGIINEDPELGREWLLIHLPQTIIMTNKSRVYKLAKKISNIAHLFKR